MKKIFCLFFMALLTLSSSSVLGDEGWQQVTDRDGIKVYTRFAQGYACKEFLGVTTVNTTPAVVNRVLNDVSGFKDWMFECPDASLLDQKGETYFVMWIVTSAPFPVSSRDCVMQTNVTIGKDKIVRNMSIATHPSKPVTKKYVRMPRLEGAWTLTAVSGGTEIKYQLKADPGGSLPDWLANMKVKDTPFGSLKGLRNQVKKPQYNK